MSDGQGATTAPPLGRRVLMLNTMAGWGANGGKIAIQLVLLPVMAHLLGPSEFGLYALALPTVGFFSILAEGGLGTSLAREDESATLVWTTAFWTLLATGVVLALITTAWGVILAALAGQPALSSIMAWLSIAFIPITMAVIPTARLTRRGNMVICAGADLAGTVLGAIVAITLALLHFGAFALAAQYVVAVLIRATVLNAAAFVLPVRRFDLPALRPHLRMGGALLGSRLIEFAGRLVENVSFGRLFGTAALGSYTFANQMPRFITEAASNPLWGALYAHALHADAGNVALLHQRFTRLLATLLFPATMLLSAAAPQLFALVLGPRWPDAALLIRILAPFYAVNAIAMINNAMLLANGRSTDLFWSVTAVSIIRVIAVAFGLLVGEAGVALGCGIGLTVGAVVLFLAGSRVTHRPIAAALRVMAMPLLASVVAGLGCAVVLAAAPSGLVWTGVGLIAGLLAYGATLFALEGARLQADVQAILRLVLRRPDGERP